MDTGNQEIQVLLAAVKEQGGAEGIMAWVRSLFTKYPVVANSAVYGTMCVTAELSQQLITSRLSGECRPIDKGSLIRYAVVGYGINSNILYFWYRWLDKTLVGRSGRTVVKKLLLDQFILTPHLLVAFYISMSVMEGKDDLTAELKEKLLPTFQRSCLFWLPAQAVNFLLVPPPARVVYVGACSFLWLNLLCCIKRNNITHQPAT